MQKDRRERSDDGRGGRWSQMTKCAAFTGKGRPCKGLVRACSDYCPGGEVRDLKDRLGHYSPTTCSPGAWRPRMRRIDPARGRPRPPIGLREKV